MPTETPAPERPAAPVTRTATVPAPADRAIIGRLAAAAARPVPADSAAVFRIAYGLLVAFGSVRFLARGWVDALYLEPAHHLTYPGFEWVRPLAAPWMHLHMAALAGLGLCIAVGYRHRLAAALFVVGFTYTELIEASLYLNHYWFVTLAGVLVWLLPVGHRWSLDAARGRVTASPVVPAGTVWALRAQVAVVYGFAGLAKLNPDWLFEAQPLRIWLADRTCLPLIGPLLDEPAVAYLASWWGAFFDCTIVGWLLWRRSRPWAFAVLVAFHLATAALFQIGIFPWVMILAVLVFFAPDWPRRLARTTQTFATGASSPVRASADEAGGAHRKAGHHADPAGGGLAGVSTPVGGGEPAPAVGRVPAGLAGPAGRRAVSSASAATTRLTATSDGPRRATTWPGGSCSPRRPAISNTPSPTPPPAKPGRPIPAWCSPTGRPLTPPLAPA